MSEILFHTPPILAITVFFLLSLVGAIVLFRFLKSTGVVSTVQGQAGGALAGFLMIFAAMQGSYLALAPDAETNAELRSANASLRAELDELRERADTELWTLQGEVEGRVGADLRGIEVRVLPPSPQELVDRQRDFRLEHVEIRNGVWPELQLSAAGHFPETVILEADDLVIHPERKLAVVRQPIALEPDPFDGSFQTADFSN